MKLALRIVAVIAALLSTAGAAEALGKPAPRHGHHHHHHHGRSSHHSRHSQRKSPIFESQIH